MVDNQVAEDRVDDPVEFLSEVVQAERRAHNLMRCDFHTCSLPLAEPLIPAFPRTRRTDWQKVRTGEPARPFY